jgi:hypothetical protein
MEKRVDDVHGEVVNEPGGREGDVVVAEFSIAPTVASTAAYARSRR